MKIPKIFEVSPIHFLSKIQLATPPLIFDPCETNFEQTFLLSETHSEVWILKCCLSPSIFLPIKKQSQLFKSGKWFLKRNIVCPFEMLLFWGVSLFYQPKQWSYNPYKWGSMWKFQGWHPLTSDRWQATLKGTISRPKVDDAISTDLVIPWDFQQTWDPLPCLPWGWYIYLPLCSLLPSASGFGVGFECLNTEPNRVFGALGLHLVDLYGKCW